jgi:hypothetical protein
MVFLNNQLYLKNFLEPAMFCHLAVLIYLCGEKQVKRYMQNKKESRISLAILEFLLYYFGFNLKKKYCGKVGNGSGKGSQKKSRLIY